MPRVHFVMSQGLHCFHRKRQPQGLRVNPFPSTAAAVSSTSKPHALAWYTALRLYINQLAALLPSNTGISNCIGDRTCCTAALLLQLVVVGCSLLHILGQCLTHSTANRLRQLYLYQLHHLGLLFCPWNLYPIWGFTSPW